MFNFICFLIFGFIAFMLYVKATNSLKVSSIWNYLWTINLSWFVFASALYILISAIFKLSDRFYGWCLILLSLAFIYFIYVSIYQGFKRSKSLLMISVIAPILMIFAGIGAASNSTPSKTSSSNNYNVVGQKLSRLHVKNHDDLYYTDKDDSNLRYFVNDDKKITAVKYVWGADHYPVTSVQNKLENVVIKDSKLKYTDDKESRDDFLPDGDSFNIYSPKRKKWYHVSLQRDDDDKVSQFSVYPGKSDDVDDY